MRPLLLVFCVMSVILFGDRSRAQFLQNLFSDEQSQGLDQDDFSSSLAITEELTFTELICRDKASFPKRISTTQYSNYTECKSNLDRMQDASYIDLTYRIRWDPDRIDLYRSNGREIYICDGKTLSNYQHQGKMDPDWWMIVRNSISYVECEEEILIEKIE